MVREVDGERITLPPAFDLHHVEGDSTKEVFEGGPDADAVTLERVEAGGFGGLGDVLEELGLGEGTVGLLELV